MSHFPRIRRTAALVVAGVALAACGGGSESARPPSATVPRAQEAAAVSTTTTIDLSVPATLDAAYLDRVMDEADARLRAAFAAAQEAGEVGAAFRQALARVYAPEKAAAFAAQVGAVGLPAFADPPGLPTTTVDHVVTARPDCVFLTAQRDLAALAKEPYQQRQPYWLKLTPEAADHAFPWRIASDDYYADGSAPPNGCP